MRCLGAGPVSMKSNKNKHKERIAHTIGAEGKAEAGIADTEEAGIADMEPQMDSCRACI